MWFFYKIFFKLVYCFQGRSWKCRSRGPLLQRISTALMFRLAVQHKSEFWAKPFRKLSTVFVSTHKTFSPICRFVVIANWSKLTIRASKTKLTIAQSVPTGWAPKESVNIRFLLIHHETILNLDSLIFFFRYQKIIISLTITDKTFRDEMGGRASNVSYSAWRSTQNSVTSMLHHVIPVAFANQKFWWSKLLWLLVLQSNTVELKSNVFVALQINQFDPNFSSLQNRRLPSRMIQDMFRKTFDVTVITLWSFSLSNVQHDSSTSQTLDF